MRTLLCLFLLLCWGRDCRSQQKDDVVVVIVPQAEMKQRKDVVGTIPKYSRLPVLSVSGSWLWVEWEGKNGWLSRKEIVDEKRELEFLAGELKRDPKNPDALLAHAAAWLRNDKPDRAVVDLDQVLAVRKDDARALQLRGEAHSRLQQFREAVADYSEAIRLADEDAATLTKRGDAWVALGEDARGLKDYTRAIELDPNDGLAFGRRGTAKVLTGDYAAALADYNEAIRLNPEDWRAYAGRGFVLTKQGDAARAIEDYTQALRGDPHDVLALQNRGALYEQTGEYADAIADYRRGLAVRPAPAIFYRRLAWVLATCPDAELRDGKVAVEHAIKSCEASDWMNVDDFEALAAALAEVGRLEEAVRWQQKVIAGVYDPARKKSAEAILKTYQDGQPHRQKPKPAAKKESAS